MPTLRALFTRTFVRAIFTKNSIVAGFAARLRALMSIPEGQPGVCRSATTMAALSGRNVGFRHASRRVRSNEKKPIFYAYPELS